VNSTTLRAFQDRLHRLGLYPAPGDGEDGPMTEAAFDAVIAQAEARLGIKPPAFPHLPAAYAWLNAVSPLPRDVAVALAMIGTKEIVGKANSPVIMAWAAEAGLTPAQYPNDETAWCGLAVAVVMKRAGKPIDAVGNILSSRAWIRFGVASPTPGLGDVLVFWRGSPDGWQGHVGIYIGEDATAYHVAGGNQSNAFTIARVAKSRLVGARRPIYRNAPPTAKPYRIAATGALSRNEA
jgi:uncharacterized protein (TIGR02594 family)